MTNPSPNTSYDASENYQLIPLNISPSVMFEKNGMKILSRGKNLIVNPDFEGANGNNLPSLWQIDNGSGHITATMYNDGFSGEFSFRISQTAAAVNTDRLAIASNNALAANPNYGISVNARVDMIGNAAAPATFTVGLQLIDSVTYASYQTILLTQTNLNAGWMRLSQQYGAAPANPVYINIFVTNLPANWNAGANNYLQVTFARPQYELSDIPGVNIISTPGIRKSDSGCVPTSAGIVREPGHCNFGNSTPNKIFSLDTSKDWGFFLELYPQINMAELVNVQSYLFAIDSHWHDDIPPYNGIQETHLYLDSTGTLIYHHNSTPDNNIANANNPPAGVTSTLQSVAGAFSSVNAYTRLRFSFWTDIINDAMHLKYQIGSNTPVIISGSAGSNPPLNMGILYRVNIGCDHPEVRNWQQNIANALFSYVHVEQGLLNEQTADNFFAGNRRPFNIQSRFLFDGSIGVPFAQVPR